MLRKPLTHIDDDTEEAPWMVLGTPQSDTASVFYTTLKAEMRSRNEALFVAMMLPILYHPIPGGSVEQLSPDVLVAGVPIHDRSSYDMEREGVPPAFVLEVVSPESRRRDVEIKPKRYERMGVEEYALFFPRRSEGRSLSQPALRGHRHDPTTGEYVHWEPDSEGRLYSAVLGLWLAIRDGELRAQRLDGSWIFNLEEERWAREQETLRRQWAEDEVARLRAELEQR